jgi:hypothetical protein
LSWRGSIHWQGARGFLGASVPLGGTAEVVDKQCLVIWREDEGKIVGLSLCPEENAIDLRATGNKHFDISALYFCFLQFNQSDCVLILCSNETTIVSIGNFESCKNYYC